MVSGFEMRVGDAERDVTATELREHFASGRLTQDELNERLDQAFAAKTRGDLQAVMTDLPSGQAGRAAGAAAAGTPTRGPGSAWIGPGAGYGRAHGAGRSAGAMVTSFVVFSALLTVGIVGAFGFGGGRPFTWVLIFAAFALLRRILFGIFGRRRGGMRGPRRRRC